MASPTYSLLLLAACSFIICKAGPLPNITSIDLGSKEGSCALGDVVYMPGDEFPGASPCEKCSCSNGDVHCAKERCEPRPGCKAVHRPDHCCPTYQCECEQEGRIYGNGEKLVDPLDPCRVCYCQGGEVVCRRIACFVRDDCRPRLVPGRCCPEYDNCPVRGVTSLPGMTLSIPNSSSVSDAEASAVPAKPVEPMKPEITIKEITPVSEIPVITDVKIKEILPSPSMEVSEYSSSKSPLIPREATSEKSQSSIESNLSIETPDAKEVLSSSLPVIPDLSRTTDEKSAEVKSKDDPAPSKISFSTQQASDNNNIFEPKILTPMMGGPSVLEVHPEPLTTKAPMIEEDELDHNPAFPPIPDDLFLVLGNHEEEIISDQNLDSEHIPLSHETINISNVQISTEEPIFKESSGTTVAYVSEAVTVTRDIIPDISSELSTFRDVGITAQPMPSSKESAMLNVRSVIPTEILSVPSLISDYVTGDILDITESSDAAGTVRDNSGSTEISDTDLHKYLNNEVQPNLKGNTSESNNDTSTTEPVKHSSKDADSIYEPDQQTNVESKSTEIISRTEFSSIPIETSDQNPRDTSDKENKDKFVASTLDSIAEPFSATVSSDSGEVILSKIIPSERNEQSLENGETTEFILASFGSQETATDAVELIKISPNADRSSALIDPPRGRNSNVLTDLINLVGDVASISNHTTGNNFEYRTSSPTTISDSEELIPVNIAAGYKSKNKNWNLNSITEIPLKSKVAVPITKQKVVEIEDDSDTITDSPPPNDKVEPTTKPPIIDNVSDDNPENKTMVTDKKDIEIITQSYVPTINRRPSKVVMKNNDEKPILVESSDENVSSTQVNFESDGNSSNEITSIPDISTTYLEDEVKTGELTTEAPSTSQ